MMRKLSRVLFFLAVIADFGPPRLSAMTHLDVICSECHYKASLDDGSLFQLMAKTGLGVRPFFCRKTHRFKSLMVIMSPDAYRKAKPADIPKKDDIALETGISVDKNSKYKLYTHKSCRNALVPLSYYRDQEKPVCPVCNRGILEVKEGYSAD